MQSDIQSARRRVGSPKRALLVTLLLAGGLIAAPSAAIAGSGSTSTIYGCKGSYSGKVAVGNCNPATKSMTIKISGDCSGMQSGYSSPFKAVTKGKSYTPYGTGSCIWNVNSIYQTTR